MGLCQGWRHLSANRNFDVSNRFFACQCSSCRQVDIVLLVGVTITCEERDLREPCRREDDVGHVHFLDQLNRRLVEQDVKADKHAKTHAEVCLKYGVLNCWGNVITPLPKQVIFAVPIQIN